MDNTAYIEAYLEGKLTLEEKVIFESRLREEPLLAEAYETHLASYHLVKANGTLRMKSMLRDYEEKKYGAHKVSMIKIVLAAAVILGMVVIFLFMLPTQKPETLDSLFAAYFSPYRDPVTVRSGAASNDVRSLANASYGSKDFASAISYYGQLPDPTPADKFYHGLSALQVKDADLAISLLTEVNLGEGDYRQQAAWYLSLAFIQDGNNEEAKTILIGIVRDKSYMNDAARSLLKKLE